MSAHGVQPPSGGCVLKRRLDAAPPGTARVSKIEEAWRAMGCRLPSPFMTMGLMSLACIPVLRQTNRGYVNCVSFQTEPLIVEETA